MRGHTPGPWRTGSNDDWSLDCPGNSTWIHLLAKGRKAPIAIICEPGLFKSTDDVLDANARLIAAAPDLLEALQRLMNNEIAHVGPYAVQAAIVAREAIAKATTQSEVG